MLNPQRPSESKRPRHALSEYGQSRALPVVLGLRASEQMEIGTVSIPKRAARTMYLGCLALILAGAGCASPSPSRLISRADATNVKRGITLQALEQMCGGRGKHQFTVQRSNVDYLTVSYAVGAPYVEYYFLFKNGELLSIVEPPAFDYKYIPWRHGLSLEVRMPVNPEARIDAVLRAPDLSDEALIESIRRRMPVKSRTSLNVLPAFVITSPLWLVAGPRVASAYKRNSELSRRFDGLKARVGADLEHVARTFGEPARVHRMGNRTVHVFGPDIALEVNPRMHFSCLAIIFSDREVVGAWSHDFYDRAFLETLPVLQAPRGN